MATPRVQKVTPRSTPSLPRIERRTTFADRIKEAGISATKTTTSPVVTTVSPRTQSAPVVPRFPSTSPQPRTAPSGLTVTSRSVRTPPTATVRDRATPRATAADRPVTRSTQEHVKTRAEDRETRLHAVTGVTPRGVSREAQLPLPSSRSTRSHSETTTALVRERVPSITTTASPRKRVSPPVTSSFQKESLPGWVSTQYEGMEYVPKPELGRGRSLRLSDL